MKTKQYISAMLVALIFATASIQAQTARRPKTQDREQAAKTSRSQLRETPSKNARSTQPARKVQQQQAYHKKATTPARKANTQQVRQHQARNGQAVKPARKAVSPARKVNTQQVHQNRARNNQAKYTKTVVPDRRAGKMSTAHTVKPKVRKANNKHYATPRYSAPKHTVKYHNRHYYGGHHYHYAYPIHKVKIHYHHDTYLHNYNVLYYPSYTNIYWTRHMYRNYRKWYPDFYWNYNYGHRIQTISVFDAKYNLGEVAMVYGRVYATWHNKETDDFLLFFGGNFPYQAFTVVLPGHVARKYSWRPQRFFLGEHITATGLITTFDGSPEMVVKNKRQINLY
jgi:hypothetical protein